MAQKQSKKATKVARGPITKKNFGLSGKAIGCLAVAALFKEMTESEIVDRLITTNLSEFAPMRGEVRFGGSVSVPAISESARQVSHNSSPFVTQG